MATAKKTASSKEKATTTRKVLSPAERVAKLEADLAAAKSKLEDKDRKVLTETLAERDKLAAKRDELNTKLDALDTKVLALRVSLGDEAETEPNPAQTFASTLGDDDSTDDES